MKESGLIDNMLQDMQAYTTQLRCLGLEILGAQFKIGKYVKIAPNFRMAMPKADNAESVYSAYLNCQVGF